MFGTYEDFRALAVNSREKLAQVANQNGDEGTVLYYVYNLGYRSFISYIKIFPDYMTRHDDSIPKEIYEKVNNQFKSFSFKVTHLNKDLTVDTFPNGKKYISNMDAASSGVDGLLCNHHLLFTCPHLANAYYEWARQDKESNERTIRLDNLFM